MATTIRRTPTRPDVAPPLASEAAPVAAEPRSPIGVWWLAYRHHLRLLRNAAIAWIAGVSIVSTGVVATFEHRIGTEAEMQALEAMENVPALKALSGRYVEIATIEGFVLSRWGMMFSILVVIWAMLASARLLRGAEEAGHHEPLRAGTISPRGLLTSALAALFTTHLVLAVVIGLTHSAAGMDVATSWALGGAAGLLAASFAAAGTLASQLAASRRRAVVIVGSLLGIMLGLRVLAAATATPEWVWWTTPFGWIGFLHEVDQARPAVFGALVALLVVLVGAALALAHRDVHAGVLARRSRRLRPARVVRTQAGLAMRLASASAATWGTVIILVVLVFGLLARDLAAAAAEFPTQTELTAEMFGVVIDTTEGIAALAFYFGALLMAALAAGQAVDIREEEATWRVEHLLVRPVARTRWLAIRVLTSVAVLALIGVVSGIAAWVATAAMGDAVTLTDGLLAGINIVPLGVLVLGVGVAVFGLAPRRTTALAHGFVVAAFVLDFVGPFLDPPGWVLQLSPFRHVAAVPAVDMDVGAAVVMLAAGVLATSVGVVAFRRRDLKEA
jgi:ABC-2 type transport system permease protein